MAANYSADGASGSLDDFSQLSVQPPSGPPAGNDGSFPMLTSPNLLKTIDTHGMVHGLAVYEHQLFVLTCRPRKIKVYNINNINFTLIREISIADTLRSPQCMDICTTNKCLYISDYKLCSVNKLPVSDEVGAITNSWQVSNKPRGISVSKNSTVLVIIEKQKCIEEYNAEGNLMRTIPHREIVLPWHCVQLSTGKYVVCHGSDKTELNRVCLMDHTGQVVSVYGGQRGNQDDQLNWPNYLALDSQDNIAVSDRENRRIHLLNSSLVRFATISQLPKGKKFGRLRALCIDDTKKRLYVGQFNGKIHVLTYNVTPATNSLCTRINTVAAGRAVANV